MLNAGAAGQQNGHLAAAAAAAANKSKEQHFMQSYFRSQKNMNHQQQQQQLQQQGYQKAGSVYSLKDHGGGNNSSSMSESEQKQIRRMRSTQSMPPGSACGCNGRSKSMEDIRDVIVDWTPEVAAINGAKQKLMNNAALLNNGSANSNYFMNQKNNHNNQGGGVGSGNSKHSETYGYNSNNRRFIANANYIINGQLANIKNKNNMRRSMDNLLDIETNYTPQFNTQVFDGDSIGWYSGEVKFCWKEDHQAIIRSAGFRSILKEQFFGDPQRLAKVFFGLLWLVLFNTIRRSFRFISECDDDDEIKFEEFGVKWRRIKMLDLRSKVGYGNRNNVQGVDD